MKIRNATIRITVLAILMLSVLQVHAVIVDVNSRIYTPSNPLEIFLEAGTYTVTPIGTADGGAYDAYSFWSSTTCTSSSGCVRTRPTTSTGWLNVYTVVSPDITSVSIGGIELTPVDTGVEFEDYFLVTPTLTFYIVDDGLVFNSAISALNVARSSMFTLSTSGLVGFGLPDRVDALGDNRGGMSFSLNAVPNLTYIPVTPCRIVDTRKTTAGIIDANTQRDFRVFGLVDDQGGDPNGCSSPSDNPLAAHINLIAVDPTGKGNLQAFPVGAGTGTGLSVNYNTIDTNLANAGSIKTAAGSGSDITVASNFSSAHTVIDVLGYYYSDEGFYYTPVDPCRIVDTRQMSAGIINASTQRDFRVSGPVADQGGDPDGCPSPLSVPPEAAHLNMVAVNPTGKGNLQAFPDGAETGTGLSVNYNTIDTNLANAGTVKTSPDITVASNFSSAHTVVDVLGYYSEEEDLLYTPVNPCRIVDTRKTSAGIIDANTQREFRVSGPVADQGGDPDGCPSPGGVPSAAHINMVAVNPTGKGNLQAFPDGAETGTGLSVNYNTIDTNLANAGTVKASPDITVASNFSSAHTVIDVLGFYYPAP